MKSWTCENDISTIILEYYSGITPLLIFQKCLNFNDISRNYSCFQAIMKFIIMKIVKFFIIKKIIVKAIFARTMQYL